MSNILDPAFKYTPSHQTDIRKTIERERKRLAALAAKQPTTQPKVTPIKRDKR